MRRPSPIKNVAAVLGSMHGEWCGGPDLVKQMRDPMVQYVKGRRIREDRLRERERERDEREKEK